MTQKIKFLGTILIALFCLATPNSVIEAANFSVSPLIIDVDALARDAFTHTITLSSHHTNAMRLFASVHEITIGEESEIKSFVPASMSDRTVAVTSWIEITRARLDLAPGATKEVPLIIKINPNTPPGLYHAFVGFAPGPNRDVAEATILSGQGSGIVLRISVGGKQEEFLRLVSFSTDRFSYSKNKGEVTYTIENTGDVALSPKGDVVIYDSRGQELTSIKLSEDNNAVIEPGQQVTYYENLPFINRLGKHKAFLSIDFGVENRASLYDTSFYYSIPWFYLVLIVLLLAIVLTALIMLFRRGARVSEIDMHEAHDIPLFVRDRREHSEYEHDIDLKKKDL
jgi:hypothetical protein